jgi:hypothetical protein
MTKHTHKILPFFLSFFLSRESNENTTTLIKALLHLSLQKKKKKTKKKKSKRRGRRTTLRVSLYAFLSFETQALETEGEKKCLSFSSSSTNLDIFF